MAAEEAGHDHEDRLSALGRVSEPAPGVLAAARERLWAVVAAEMLGDAPTEETAREQGVARRDARGQRGEG